MSRRELLLVWGARAGMGTSEGMGCSWAVLRSEPFRDYGTSMTTAVQLPLLRRALMCENHFDRVAVVLMNSFVLIHRCNHTHIFKKLVLAVCTSACFGVVCCALAGGGVHAEGFTWIIVHHPDDGRRFIARGVRRRRFSLHHFIPLKHVCCVGQHQTTPNTTMYMNTR